VTRAATPVNFTLALHGRTGPRASQVAHALIEAIAAGQVHDGDRLPSTRTLAATFSLPRTAAVGAYEELTAAGFLAARPGGSTYVEQGAGAAARAGAFGSPLPPPSRPVSPPAGRVEFDLRPGQADTELISQRDWAQAMRLAALPARQPADPDDVRPGRGGQAGQPLAGTGPADARPSPASPGPASPGGAPGTPGAAGGWPASGTSAGLDDAYADLREQLSGHMRRARGLAADPDDIFLFPSLAMGLRAVASACGLAGGQVAFEDPGYGKARLALREAGVTVRPVAVDDDGLQVADLGPADRACYVTPAHQYPLGGRMSVRRRAGLLDWAAAQDALVLEDDYDGEFRYDVPPLIPLRSMPAGAERVVYFGTSSKILARGMRVSWAVLPARYRAAMAAYLDRAGGAVSCVSAAFLASFIATGALTRHQARAMRTYSARQARFVAACRELIPGVRALGIEAGLHVVLAFDQDRPDQGRPDQDRPDQDRPDRGQVDRGQVDRGLDDVAAAARLAGLGLACAPLSRFYADPASAARTGLVCGYSRLPETRARAAAGLIGQVVAGLGPHGPGGPGGRRSDDDGVAQDLQHRG
jgi:GntR family transcriptional regulator/MocR family aminotransferase